MTARQKKLASNLLFGVGLLVAVLGVVLTAVGGPIMLFAFAMLAFGLVAALAGIVIGFIPARRS